ncbi:MAG: hypothetical protein KC636_33180, partial [Myxococcales bacterium]|nr:hypothetical protein [Myxococcales bacterium]
MRFAPLAAFVAALLVEPRAVAAAAAPTSTPARGRFTAIVLSASPELSASLRQELELRLPDVPVYVAAERGLVDPAQPHVYVAVALQERGHGIRVTTSDGRVYVRAVDSAGDEQARVSAGAIANLILSIEAGTITPDEFAAPPLAEAPVEAPVEAPPKEHVQIDRNKEPAAPPRPRLELGLGGHAGALLGPGPPRYGDVFLGGYGGLDLLLRGRGGGLGLIALRAGGRAADGERLVRLRVLAGAGYAWRGDRVELAVALALFVEPWLVTPSVGLRAVGGAALEPRGPPPLFGAALLVSPGYLLPVSRGPLRALRIGPRLELSAAAALRDGAQVVVGTP